MPGGRSGLYPGIEKLHQSAEYKQREAENDLLRAVGRDRLLQLARAERDGLLVILDCEEESIYQGLKQKYIVFKRETGEELVGCFVLRPDKDSAAVEALKTYAKRTENKMLAIDISKWIERITKEQEG